MKSQSRTFVITLTIPKRLSNLMESFFGVITEGVYALGFKEIEEESFEHEETTSQVYEHKRTGSRINFIEKL